MPGLGGSKLFEFLAVKISVNSGFRNLLQRRLDLSVEIGLAASTPGNRVYAALRGMVDAGLEVPHGEDVLPDDDRVNGAHIDESIADKVEACRTTIEEAY